MMKANSRLQAQYRSPSYLAKHNNHESRERDAEAADKYWRAERALAHVPKWPCNRPKTAMESCRMTKCYLFDTCDCDHCGEATVKPWDRLGDGRAA